MSDIDSIYVLRPDADARRVEQTPYETEELLQQLLQDHPALLAGHLMDDTDPPRWLLVGREVGVPDAGDAANRWALDHLFIDHTGVPTFVEVKRATDTRIRREVAGQMLDYAANAQRYWPIDRIRQLAEAEAGGAEQLQSVLGELLDADEDEDRAAGFWDTVEANLRAGRVRLAFVADRIPPELRRIIEFLNEQMPAVHVIGLELAQYVHGDLRVVVPRAVGVTEAVRATKSKAARGPASRTTESELLAACSADVADVMRGILDEARRRELLVYWGAKGFSVSTPPATHGARIYFLYAFPPGTNGREHAAVQAYVHPDYFDEQQAADHRDGLRDAAPSLIPRGRFTLELALNGDGLAQVSDMLAVLWRWEENARS